MALYAQQTTNKRQKTIVREAAKNCESNEYFPGLSLVEYRPEAGPEDTLCYRHYHATERVHGRTMEDWLRPAVSFNHAFCQKIGMEVDCGPHPQRSWDDGTNTLDSYKRRIKAAFEFYTKLGTKYWTFYDRDVAPEGDTLEETGQNLDEAVELIAELQTRTGIKPLWVAANLHSHSRYVNGAATSPDAHVTTYAAAQTKRAMEMAHKLNAECYLLKGGHEGYTTVLNTDFSRELHNYSRHLKMTSNFKDRLGYRGQLLFESSGCGAHARETHCYDTDAISALYMLKHYNLERSYKMSVVPGHQLFMTSAYGMLGSIDITMHSSPPDIKETTLLMKTVIEQGGMQPGGLNIGVNLPKQSTDLKELMVAYVSYIDIYARGLRNAAKMVADGVFAKNLQQRYLSYHTGFGSRLANGEASLEDCEDMARKHRGDLVASCGRPQHWEAVFSRYI